MTRTRRTRDYRTTRRLSLERLEGRCLPSTSIPLNRYSWTQLGPAPLIDGSTQGDLACSGRVTGLAPHPTNADILYAATAGGGVWKTDNATATDPAWSPITDTQASLVCGSIAIAPSAPNTIYVGTGEANHPNPVADSFYGRGVLKSTDGGGSWNLLGAAVFDRRSISRIVVDPNNANRLFACVSANVSNAVGGNTGIWRSVDGGVNWTLVSTGIGANPNTIDLEMVPGSPNTLLAVVIGGGIWRTPDAHLATPNWTQLGGNLPTSGFRRGEVAVTPANPNVFVASFEDTAGNLLGVYRSTDAGQSWANQVGNPGMANYMGTFGFYAQTVTISPFSADVVYVGGVSVRRTDNGGTTWIDADNPLGGPHADHHAGAFDRDGQFIAGTDGGVFQVTAPLTNTWRTMNGAVVSPGVSRAMATMQLTAIALHPTNPNIAFAGSQDNGTMRFNDNLGWRDADNGGDGGFVRVDPNNPNNVYHTYQNTTGADFFRRSTDGGATWTSATSNITNAATGQFYIPYIIDPVNSNHLILGTTTLYHTVDNAGSWYPLGSQVFTAIDAIGKGPANGTFYVAAGTTVWVTTDGAGNWANRTPAGAIGTFTDIAVDPLDSNVAYVVNNGYTGNHVWRTTDAGQTWTNISSDLPVQPVWSIAHVRDSGGVNLYVGTDTGVYRSQSLGVAWQRFGGGLPNVQVRDLEVAGARLAAGTYGRGMWQIELNSERPPQSGSGTVYNDFDADGVFDPGEPGRAGVRVYFDSNRNGVYDSILSGPNTYTSHTLPLTVPDPGVAQALVNVQGLEGQITDIDVLISMTHTYDSDMSFTLVSPDGVRVLLINRRGADGDNFFDTRLNDDSFIFVSQGTPPFTGSYAPEEELRALNGSNPVGVWLLEMRDNVGQDVGTLIDFKLIITTGEYFQTSDAAGNYLFPIVGNGTIIRAVPPGGFRVTGPAGGSYTIAGGPGFPAVTGLDFGLAQTSNGIVYTDNNVNGVFDFFGVDSFLAGVRVYDDANNNGSLDQTGPFSYDATGLPADIPDLGSVSAPFTVSGLTGRVNRVVLALSFEHTYCGDLVFTLISPSGSRVVLVRNRGGGNDNVGGFTYFDDEAAQSIVNSTPTWNGFYRPEEPLAGFDGEDPNGTWQLQITDTAGADVGRLYLAVLEIHTGERYVRSGADGSYYLPLPTGTHIVRSVPGAGMTVTEPEFGGHAVVIGAGGSGSGNRNFGHAPVGMLPPRVVSIAPAGSPPSNAASVPFAVTFSKPVTGVSLSDFIASATGSVSGAVITGITGSGANYTVTVSIPAGNGTVRVALIDNDDSIRDAENRPLGGPGAGNGDFTNGQVHVVDRPPVGAPPNIGGGATPAQRAMIGALGVAFNEVVVYAGAPEAAYRLERIVGGVPAGNVAFTVATAYPNNTTMATITPTSNVQFGSLMDGRYRLTVVGSQIQDLSGQSLGADSVTNFHRYFGDIDGNEQVDNVDFFAFRLALGNSIGSPGFRAGFDYDNSGNITNTDFFQFRIRLGVPLP